MSGVPGSQAEWCRVHFADTNCFGIPDDVPDEKALDTSDVLCTSLPAVTRSKVTDGETVAIWGRPNRHPRRAQIKGAKRLIGIDLVPERLALAQKLYGIDVIDRREVKDVAKRLKEMAPEGIEVCIEAAGFR